MIIVFLMFSSSQGTTKLVFHTVIWESECLGNWWLIYIVQQIVFRVIYLLLFTKRLPYLANPSWPWYLSSCLSSFLYISFLLSFFVALVGPRVFMLSCSKGQGTLVSFSLLPVIHEQWASSHAKFLGQFKGFQKLSIHRTTLLSQQHVMMSKCHMTCNNYIRI